MMTRFVQCKKLGTYIEGLDFLPFPGTLGQEIYHSISKAAWQQWLKQQTMLINEYRLNTLEAKTREFLNQEMQNFLFNEGSATPENYTPPNE